MIAEVLCNRVVCMQIGNVEVDFPDLGILVMQEYSIYNGMSRQGQCCSWVPFLFVMEILVHLILKYQLQYVSLCGVGF